MPGPSPRSGFTARIGSSARRGANVPAGVPGVYRVPRVRIQSVASDLGAPGRASGWIQGPDYILTLALTGKYQWQTTTPQVDPGSRTDSDFAVDVGEGEDLNAPPSAASGVDSVLDTLLVLTYVGDNLEAEALRSHNGLDGSSLTSLELGVISGDYTPPGESWEIEYETPTAVFAGAANLSGDVASTTGSAGSGSPAVSGSLWVAQTHYNPFRPVSEIVADDTQLDSWSGSSTPWSLDTTATALFGATPESGQMALSVLNTGLTVPGTVTRPTTGPPSGQAVASASITDLTLVLTMRPPRHRFI